MPNAINNMSSGYVPICVRERANMRTFEVHYSQDGVKRFTLVNAQNSAQAIDLVQDILGTSNLIHILDVFEGALDTEVE